MRKKHDSDTEVKFLITPEERSLADAYLSSTGGKRATFAKTLFLREIARASAISTLRPELTPQGLATATTYHPGLCAAAVAPVVDPANKGETA